MGSNPIVANYACVRKAVSRSLLTVAAPSFLANGGYNRVSATRQASCLVVAF